MNGQEALYGMLKWEDTVSPTVHHDSIFISCAIQACENGDVAMMDLPDVFLHTSNDDDMLLMLKGRLAELMVLVAPHIH